VNCVVHSCLIRNEIKQILSAYVDSLEIDSASEEEANQRDPVMSNVEPISSALRLAMDHASLTTTALSIKRTSALDGVTQAISMAQAMGGSAPNDEHSIIFSESDDEPLQLGPVDPLAGELAASPPPPTIATVAKQEPRRQPLVAGLPVVAGTSPPTTATLAEAESIALVTPGDTRFTAEMQLQMRNVFGDDVLTKLLQHQPQVVYRDPDERQWAHLQARVEHLTRAAAMRMHQSPTTFSRPLLLSQATKSAELLVVAEANADGTFQRCMSGSWVRSLQSVCQTIGELV
jgi:hypothetical protein